MLRNDAPGESHLIRQAQAGDRSAFAALYDRHQPDVYSYLYYRVSDQSIAEELTAEVFCRMVEKIEHFQHRGKPILAWLYTIARNLLADHYRQARRANLPLTERLAAREGNPAQAAEKQLTADCLRLALHRLTQEQREVIIGKFVQGRSNAEVGAILGKSEGAIKSLQHRALAALRRAIDKEGCYEP
jgi:RNA polymerase sigma-70 factor (ECF subfamily)